MLQMETSPARSDRPSALLGITLATALWGLSFVSTKALLRTLLPVQVAFMRHVIASVATLAVAVATRQSLKVRPSDMPRMLAASIIGIPVYFYFENTGLLYLPAATASMITASTPAITAVMETLYRGKRLPAWGWMGILVSAAGVGLVVRAGAMEAAASRAGMDYFLKGALMLLLSSLSWAVYTIVNRPIIARYSVFTVNSYQVPAATLVLAAASWLTGKPTPWADSLRAPNVLLNLLYLGVACSALSYGLYLHALRALGSTSVSSFINLVPVFGVLGSAALLGEPLSAVQLAGGVLVISGIFIVDASQRATASTGS